jgi:hypothetical protein
LELFTRFDTGQRASGEGDSSVQKPPVSTTGPDWLPPFDTVLTSSLLDG